MLHVNLMKWGLHVLQFVLLLRHTVFRKTASERTEWNSDPLQLMWQISKQRTRLLEVFHVIPWMPFGLYLSINGLHMSLRYDTVWAQDAKCALQTRAACLLKGNSQPKCNNIRTVTYKRKLFYRDGEKKRQQADHLFARMNMYLQTDAKLFNMTGSDKERVNMYHWNYLFFFFLYIKNNNNKKKLQLQTFLIVNIWGNSTEDFHCEGTGDQLWPTGLVWATSQQMEEDFSSRLSCVFSSTSRAAVRLSRAPLRRYWSCVWRLRGSLGRRELKESEAKYKVLNCPLFRPITRDGDGACQRGAEVGRERHDMERCVQDPAGWSLMHSVSFGWNRRRQVSTGARCGCCCCSCFCPPLQHVWSRMKMCWQPETQSAL